MTTDLSRPVPPNGSTPTTTHEVPRGAPATPLAAPRLVAPGRRRPAVWGLGLALVMAGGAVAAATTMAAGDRAAVLSVVRPVDAGTVIEARDLGEARVAPDPMLDPIPADQRDRVLGQVAGVDLRPGTLLTPSQLEERAIPGADQALVGVALDPGRLPARRLQRGDRVLAVVTAQEPPIGVESGVPATEPPGTRVAEVVSTGRVTPDGRAVVDLLVPEGEAAGLAADAAAARISLVLLPRAG